MKKIYFLLIAIFIGNIANAQNWQPFGSDDFNQPTQNSASKPTIATDLNGIPYVAYADMGNNNKVCVRKYINNNWVYVGTPGFSSGYAESPSIVFSANGTPYVIFSDFAYNKKATVMKFNGTNWINVGNPGFTSCFSLNDIDLVIDSTETPYVLFKDSLYNYKLTIMKFNGSNWINIGTPGFFSTSAFKAKNTLAINQSGKPYIAFAEYKNSNNVYYLKVKKFNGNSWENVGDSILFGSQSYIGISIAISPNGIPYVACLNFNNNFVKKFDGNNWVNVGPYLDMSEFSKLSFWGNAPIVNYSNTLVRYFNGISWENIGNVYQTNISVNYSDFSTNSTGNAYVIYSTESSSSVRRVKVMKLQGNIWKPLGDTSNVNSFFTNSSLALNKTGELFMAYHPGKLIKHNGYNWVNIGSNTFSNSHSNISLDIDSVGKPYIAVLEYVLEYKIKVKSLYGNWVDVGGEVGSANYYNPISFKLNKSAIPHISYIDKLNNNKVTLKKFSNNSWVNVGNPVISSGNSYYTDLAIDMNNTPYVVYNDSSLGDKAVVKKFNGSSWVAVGTEGFSAGKVLNPTIAIDNANTLYVSYIDAVNGNKVIAKKFSGNSWVNIGNAFVSQGSASSPRIYINDDIPYLLYCDSLNGCKAIVKYFDGINWVNLGTYISAGIAESPELAFDAIGNIYIKYISGDYWFKKFTIPCINPINGGVISSNQDICSGDIPNLIINSQNPTGQFGNLNFKWQSSIISDSTGFFDITGATDSIYQPLSLSTTTWYRRLAKVSCQTNWMNAAISNPIRINVNYLPDSAGIITGNSSIIAGQQNVIYTIPSIFNATYYTWELPNGTSLNTFTGNSININYSQLAVSGNISVFGSNLCGDGVASSLYVTVNPFNPNCSAQFDLMADTTTPHHYFAVNNASGIPPLQYNWSWGDGSFSTTANPTHTYSASGNYKICLTIIDSVGCTTTYCDSSYLQKDPNAIISVQVIPQGSLGINSLLSDKIKIYPNPAKENLIIELIESHFSQKTSISIYNIQGQLCRQIISNQLKTEVDIKDLSAGLYVIKLNNEKESFVSKFVKD